jgi:hypothetical protein
LDHALATEQAARRHGRGAPDRHWPVKGRNQVN